MLQCKHLVLNVIKLSQFCIIFTNSVEPINPSLSNTNCKLQWRKLQIISGHFLNSLKNRESSFSSPRIVPRPHTSLTPSLLQIGTNLWSRICWISLRVLQTQMYPRIFAPVKWFNSAARGGLGAESFCETTKSLWNREMGAGTTLYTLSAHKCRQPEAITLGRCWSETGGGWV